MKYIIFIMIFMNFAICAKGNGNASDEGFDKISKLDKDIFIHKFTDEYLTKLISLTKKLTYPDDSIKVIKNAPKNKNQTQTRPSYMAHTYFLESVITAEDSFDWFAVINSSIYTEKKKICQGVFNIVKANDRYILAHFLNPTKNDIDNIKKHQQDGRKYAENINISDDEKYISVLLYVGQTYDCDEQRVYDGFVVKVD